MSESKEYTREFLHMMYNGTSTSMTEGEDDLESYEYWMERQLISRLEKIDALESKNKELVDLIEMMLFDWEHHGELMNDTKKRIKEAGESIIKSENSPQL